ncbi:hypothetical protein K443DRAFT_101847 [Laccaria amethystina LaAM-08-1]|uniref:XPG-I domain-containing protein n=1 Tax=Laccaria amethystina LaAM-08-1 TaxID=1095629 RepID=A0A0C9WP45_9AGAR|nr:hypothetical protein K443DRAFT_101847 [Laccaria amethystina LaAM-08-1]
MCLTIDVPPAFISLHPGHLQIFFFKLCKFLRSPATWVFVFDGPNRPTIKRGKAVNSSTAPSWVGPCKDLIECFGFHVHQAPGEGEAELGKLSSHGFIDVILTTDSDIFVFGGSCVLRR